jgi:DNA primase
MVQVSLLTDLDLKERIRAAVDIVDLMGVRMELRRQGRNFVARCPWHDDRRPSLTINPERQSWRCWPCGIGGDIFSFVMRDQGVEFPEAIRFLADRAGIEIETKERGGKSGLEKKSLLEIVLWAERLFYDCLSRSPEGASARKYLNERGITEESRQKFRIGFAPENSGRNWLLERALKEGHPPKMLEAVGLLRIREGTPEHYDWFRGRLMFPIRDLRNQPVAFGGRILPELASDFNPKYINSPETPLFSKSKQLYGLDVARDAVQKQKNVLVMEGYTDVIMAHQHGQENAVAVLGTALGEEHIRILKRFTERVTLVLDGDDAGQRNADRVLDLFVAAEVDLRVLTLPDEYDPAEFLLEKGREAFQDLVLQAPDAFEHKLRKLTAGVDLMQDTHQATAALEALLKIVAQAPMEGASVLKTQQLLLRFSRFFSLPVEGIRSRLEQLQKRRHASQEKTKKPPTEPSNESPRTVFKLSPKERISGADRELFEFLLEAPEIAPRAVEWIDPVWLHSNAARVLFDAFQRLDIEGHSMDYASLMLVVDDPALKGIIVELDERVRDRHQRISQGQVMEVLNLDERWSSIASRYQQASMRRTMDHQVAKLESAQLETQEELDVLKQLIESQRARHQL